MGQTLKVLNAARFYDIGIPVTYAQYSYTTPQHLISRLTARNLHLLALRVSDYLGLSPELVLKHWAVAKIKRSSAVKAAEKDEDEETCRLIVDKFGEGVGGAYADIARKAWESGRSRLATLVSDLQREEYFIDYPVLKAIKPRTACSGPSASTPPDEGRYTGAF